MKFGFVDSIIELTRGKRIVAIKAVSLAEEYLSDHFPTFPVLPGVLMLEALTEAAAWLVRDALDFLPSVVLLQRAKNVIYKDFVRPGTLLRVEVDCRRLGKNASEFSGVGFCRENEVVKARFSMTHFSVGDGTSGDSPIDQRLVAAAKAKFALLCGQATKQ